MNSPEPVRRSARKKPAAEEVAGTPAGKAKAPAAGEAAAPAAGGRKVVVRRAARLRLPFLLLTIPCGGLGWWYYHGMKGPMDIVIGMCMGAVLVARSLGSVHVGATARTYTLLALCAALAFCFYAAGIDRAVFLTLANAYVRISTMLQGAPAVGSANGAEL